MPAFSEALTKAGFADVIAKHILDDGFDSIELWLAAFVDNSAFEGWLTKLQFRVGAPFAEIEKDEWLTSAQDARLRLFWSQHTKGAKSAPQNTPANSPVPLLGMPVNSALSPKQVREMWSQFDTDYPAEVLQSDCKPCKQLIQQVYEQRRRGELKFIPWKGLLSEVQFDKSKESVKAKEHSLLGILAEAVGVSDHVEADVSASPFGVQRALALLATTWALVQWCHLGSAKLLVNRFMMSYHRVGLSSTGLRPPSLQEAESADAELCRQLQELISKGNSLDAAIHETIVVRDCLQMWLNHVLVP